VSRVPVTGDEIREAFLRFFEGKGHKRLQSSPLIPQGDPTMLLTTAGMVQIKPYFLGLATPPNPRLASCQKCFRTTDIEAVGDTKHLTFFEMLGNFSVGDYFKREAIGWAWEFVTQWLKLPPERLWITIFLDDEEAFKYWQEVGVPAERIVRFGEKDNFWGPAGDSGPCGPCSEIIYDFGEEFGCGKPDCGPGCDCPRFSEIWNLVFTQYNQDKEGQRTPLPKPNIDTGMGLERTAAVMQGKISVYETDLFTPIVARVCELAGKQYGQDEAVDRAIRIVAEHARGIPFLIADEVVPSNEGRGYVLRRVLRRATRFGRKLGLGKPFLNGKVVMNERLRKMLSRLGGSPSIFLAETASTVIGEMGHLYPELVSNQDFIFRVINLEEERFGQTLDTGLNWLDRIMERAEEKREKRIGGDEVFMLYDTYGFPKELTAEIAAERGFSVDMEGFEQKMERQRLTGKVRGKASVKGELSIIPRSTDFVGYESLKHESTIVVLLRDSESVEKGQVDSVSKGQDVGVILRQTPFYGEMGGQVGDTGEIRSSEGKVAVLNTLIRRMEGTREHVVHQGKVVEGQISVGDVVEAEVDASRRLDIARNHTATHLLQAALRAVLGEHVRQSGSLVAPDRLRFDFTHLGSISKEQLAEIQRLVNEKIRENLPVKVIEDIAYTEALSMGAIALFEEKYGEKVRVLKIGDPPFSMEVCGGTHVKSTGEIGFFHVTTEGSIGSGMRRIEAVTGRGAERFLEQRLSTLEALAQELEASPEEAQGKLSATLAELDRERKRALAFERKLAAKEAEDLRVKTIEGVNLVSGKVSVESPEAMRAMGDRLKERLGSGVIVLGAIYNDRPNFMAMVTPDLVAKGFHAGEIVKQIAMATGGGGGGRAELGQGSGKDSTKLDEALKQTGRYIQMHYDKDSGIWRTRVD
jgi:alanyl-tRNA synthetase